MRLISGNYKSHWFTLVIYDQEKIMSDLSMCHGKVTEFVSIPLFRFTLVIKLRNFNFESHWNILMFFDKETYDVRFADFHGKMSDFVSFLLFGFTLVRKLRNFDFKGHLNTVIFLIKKWCQIWLCPVKQCLIWLKLRFLSKILAISWEIRMLNVIKII